MKQYYVLTEEARSKSALNAVTRKIWEKMEPFTIINEDSTDYFVRGCNGYALFIKKGYIKLKNNFKERT